MEDKAYSKEPLKGKKEHTWFKKIGNSYHTDWNVYFDELSDDWKIIIDKFCNDLFNATSFSIKNAYVFRDVKLHIRDEDKKAFLLEERKKVIEEIRNNKRHDWLEWQPSTVKDDDTLKLALKKAFWNQRSVFRTEYEQNISKNPDFKFENPSLVEYISNLKLLNYIESYLNSQQTNEENKASYLAIYYATIWNQEGIDLRDEYKTSTEFYKAITKKYELTITPNIGYNKKFQYHYLKLMPKIPGLHLMNEQANKNKGLLKTRISTIKVTLKNCDFTIYPKAKKYLEQIIEFS
jgi:hypothetical protein